MILRRKEKEGREGRREGGKGRREGGKEGGKGRKEAKEGRRQRKDSHSITCMIVEDNHFVCDNTNQQYHHCHCPVIYPI